MAFLNGRASYTRLRVSGRTFPIGDKFLTALKSGAFQEAPAPRIGTPEAGFTTGAHMLDTSFSYEKNIFGQCAHFAIRVDQHQVPGEFKKALRVQNEQAAAKASQSGFASRADKSDAKDAAAREIDEALKSGKYRKTKIVPIIWDVENELIYVANGSTVVIEELAKLMREAFGVKLQVLSAGARAAEILSGKPKALKAWEDLRPTPFSKPPAASSDDETPAADRAVPGIPWAAKAYDLRDFIGNEFLMWLMWRSQEGVIDTQNAGAVSVTPWRSLDLDCAWAVTGKTALRVADGSPLRSPECKKAVAAGKWPRKLGMMLANAEFALQGDQLAVSGLKFPEIDSADSDREQADARVALLREFDRTLDETFQTFLRVRMSSRWAETAAEIAKTLGGKA